MFNEEKDILKIMKVTEFSTETEQSMNNQKINQAIKFR